MDFYIFSNTHYVAHIQEWTLKIMLLVNIKDRMIFDLLHVLRLARDTEVLEHVGQEFEGGSFERILLPALQHDL